MQISLLMSQSLSNKGRPYENIQEHRMIINAIKTGDKSLAEETAKFHVRKSRDNILLKIKGINFMVTKELVKNILNTKYEDIPAEVIEHAKKSFYNWMGVAIRHLGMNL